MSGQCVTVLSSGDTTRWRDFMSRLPAEQQDVYMLPEYHALFETPSIQAACFVFEADGEVALYPYLKTHICDVVSFEADERLYDIEGVYGYNGIIASTADPAFLEQFEQQFKQYCRQTGIIAEFVRFSPVLKNNTLSGYLEKTVFNRNIIVDLHPSVEEIWHGSYEQAARKNINKARKNGLQVVWLRGPDMAEDWLTAFTAIYHDTMDRKGAESFYYFDRDFFTTLSSRLAQNCLFFFTLQEDRPVSCELVLMSRTTGYSFLGGTLPDAFPLRPNNLLKHEIILQLKQRGFVRFCLGGGSTMGDGVYRYKKTFSKNGETDFYIGRCVHNTDAYQTLCDAWEKKYPEKAPRYKNFFLKYKQ